MPQFLNVLKGEMSVVGPRPERPYFVDKFLSEISHYDTRHRLKVGITGWAQVNGWRGDTSIAKRLEFDRYYLQNWSFWFDLRATPSHLRRRFALRNPRTLARLNLLNLLPVPTYVQNPLKGCFDQCFAP